MHVEGFEGSGLARSNEANRECDQFMVRGSEGVGWGKGAIDDSASRPQRKVTAVQELAAGQVFPQVL